MTDQTLPEELPRIEWWCGAFDQNGHQIGSFVVVASSMGEALTAAGSNIEVKIRPDQYEVRVKKLTDAKLEATKSGRS